MDGVRENMTFIRLSEAVITNSKILKVLNTGMSVYAYQEVSNKNNKI